MSAEYLHSITLVDGLVTRILKERGEKARVIATGGLADLIAPESETTHRAGVFDHDRTTRLEVPEPD